jgi:hypothetical protein
LGQMGILFHEIQKQGVIKEHDFGMPRDEVRV